MKDENHYLNIFDRFVTDIKISDSIGFKESNVKYHVISCMIALQKDSKNQFLFSLKKIKERNFNEHTPWIYDDILLFILSVGITRFEIDKDWINNLCLTRSKVQEGSNKAFTETIHYLINGSGSTNHFGILFLSLNNKEIAINKDELNEAFINAKQDLETSTDTISRCFTQAAIHHIIKLKGLDNLAHRKKQHHFLSTFQRKAKLISHILFWVLFPLFIFVFYYLVYLSVDYLSGLTENPTTTFLSNIISSISSLAPIYFILIKKKQFINWFREQVYFFWGDTLLTEQEIDW